MTISSNLSAALQAGEHLQISHWITAKHTAKRWHLTARAGAMYCRKRLNKLPPQVQAAGRGVGATSTNNEVCG
ncbi:hypothetical protein KIF59_23170 [Enterobacter cloacae subsp. cloacae]|nr:hypothetical protein [Enterobacter cloacae subsp. cloacae]